MGRSASIQFLTTVTAWAFRVPTRQHVVPGTMYVSFQLTLRLPREPVRIVFKLQVRNLGLGVLADDPRF